MAPQTTAAGNRFTQVGFNDPNDGMFIGGTGTAPAAGTSTGGGMLFLPATKNANRATPDPENTIVTGDDGEVAHQYDWTSIASRGFAIELSAEDLTQSGVIQNMPVVQWLGGQYGYEDIANVQLPNMTGILQSRSKRISDGVGVWGGVFIANGQVRYLGRAGFNERGAALYRYFMTPAPSGYNHLGFTIFDNAGQQKYARGVPFQGLPYPVTLHAAKADGIVTLWLVDKAPVSVALSDAIGERVRATVSAVATTVPFSVSTTTAIAAGKRVILPYLFQP